MSRNSFDININLKGFPNAQKQINATKEGMDRMRLSTSGLRRSIGALRNNMLLYAFTVGAVTRVTNTLIASYREQIQAERLLENNLKNVAGVSIQASENLKGLASSLQQVTTFGDESIINAQSLAATFQLNEDTIARLTPRILDMSAAMGTDLRSSALLLGKAFIGETSRLKQIGLVVDEFGLASARAKGPIEEAAFLLKTFDDNFKGAAEAIRNTPLGELDGLNMALGDMTEQLGKTAIPLETFITKLKLGAVESLTTWAFFFTEWSKLSRGGIQDMFKMAEAWQKSIEKVKALTDPTKVSLDDFGEASVNNANQAAEAEAKRQEAIDKSIQALTKERRLLEAKREGLFGADLATVRSIELGRDLTEEEEELIKTIEKYNKAIQKKIDQDKSDAEQDEKRLRNIREINKATKQSGLNLAQAQALTKKALEDSTLSSDENYESELKRIEVIKRITSELGQNIDFENELFHVLGNVTGELQRNEQGNLIATQSLFGFDESLMKAIENIILEENQLIALNEALEENAKKRAETETDEEALKRRREINQEMIDMLNQTTSLWGENMKARKDAEISALKSTEEYRNATTEERQNMEKDALGKFKDEATAKFRIEQASSIASIAMSVAEAVAKSAVLLPATLGSPLKELHIALGIAQAAIVAGQKPPAFALGGDFVTQGPQSILVGDNPGGRERVQVTPLSSPNINGPQGGNVTINVSAPLVDETVLDTIIPAIENAQKMNLA